ncbi:methyltransferase-like protein 7A [Penaeus japonicus]|uniref:methyltransferase-like protein 7A n=1 Tax=Penaeus japonicus TaxID=27405 RepID=UPI001C717071|nr:methyltransferase-like protein 7A [Penaeus japonicus]
MNTRETMSWWVSSNALYVMLAIVLLSLLNYFKGDSLSSWLSAIQLFNTTKPAVKLEEVKKQLFVGLGREVSHDPMLRERRAIRILEIGAGTGSNFAYYPPDTHLVVVDPNPNFAKYFQANKDKFDHIRCERVITSTGERMDMVPDNSVDVVVMTQVLCTIGDPCKILQQIIRVLVPGGKFYFFEHIREFDSERHRLRQKLQDLLTTSGIAPYFLEGCCLNKDMLPAIGAAGFSKVRAERFYAPIDSFIYQLVKPCLKGIAEK